MGGRSVTSGPGCSVEGSSARIAGAESRNYEEGIRIGEEVDSKSTAPLWGCGFESRALRFIQTHLLRRRVYYVGQAF